MSLETPTSTPAAAPETVESDALISGAGVATSEVTPSGGRPRPRLPKGVKTFLSNKKAMFGFTLLSLIVIAAICAPLLTSADPIRNDFEPYQHPSWAHPFGTTDYGQDLFAQVVYGAQVSLLVGAGAAFIATCIATVFGLLAAYRPGFIDGFVNMWTNIFLVIPLLPLLIVVSAFVPQRGGFIIALMIGFTVWAGETRVLRGQALGLRGRDFILAAKLTGESTPRIIFGEFVPNMISRIVAGFILTFSAAIYFEAALEFLGMGDAHQTTWGTALYWAANGSAVPAGHWWDFVFPGFAIALTIVALVFLQYGVDELSNPKLRNLPKKKKKHALRNAVHAALNGRSASAEAAR